MQSSSGGGTLSVRAIVETFASQQVREALAGGASALERLVGSVGTISTTEEMTGQRPNSLVIIPPQLAVSGDIGLDLILRRAAAVRVSCVVVEAGASTLPTATRRLAEQFHIALWREPELDPVHLRSRIEHLVRNPDLVGAGVIRTVGELMIRPAANLGEIVERLGRALGYPTALVGADGRSVSGPTIAPAEYFTEGLSALEPGITDTVIESEPGQRILLTSAFPLAADQPRFWLATQVPQGLDSRASHVLTALRIASLALSANLAQISLSYERDNRQAGTLLDEILRSGDRLALAEVERATALGWQLFGWHVAVQVSAESSVTSLPPATLARSLAEALSAQGLEVRPVHRGSAVVFWTTATIAPGPEHLASLGESIRLALGSVERSFPGIRLRAGLGSPREGTKGIAQSIDDARYALAFAESGQGHAIVQRTDTMTANRLIRSWVPGGAAREVVSAIIDPLRAADADGQLVLTLRTYLDHESNASEAAVRLHVHRNTVIQRMRRVRGLLDADLDDPHDRLAVQVALRLSD